MRQYVKVYFQSTGDTEWAENIKKSFFLKNSVESIGMEELPPYPSLLQTLMGRDHGHQD